MGTFTAYCTIAQVEAEGSPANKPYTTTTRPTLTQVESFAQQVYNEINARLSAAGVTTPIVSSTSPTAYALMTELNALGAAAKALRVAFTGTEPNTSAWVAELRRQYEEKLAWYCENLDALSDASVSTGGQVLSRTHDLTDTDAPDDITSHRFYRGQDW